MDERHCPRCGQTKQVAEFFRNRARSSGFSPYCRACHTAAGRERRQQQRLALFDLLGGRFCAECGIGDARVLVFDHIDGGGAAHHRTAGSGHSVMRYIGSHPDEFRVLCHNCNFLARLDKGQSGRDYAARVAAAPTRDLAIPRQRWATRFDACTECGQTTRRHHGRGLCTLCFSRGWNRERGIPRGPRNVPTAPWARDFACCVSCGTTDNPHNARGLCRRCYMRDWEALGRRSG